jgi:glycosyltransferase involved in cell wall biosynthesis
MAGSSIHAARGVAREVPAHDLELLGPKAHRHALVIPVLNEGERIRGQLRNIAALRPRVDVVIADGGSADGSVAPDFLREVGVRALLTKRGPGRLSAQLRMAYAWCLDEGYHGIVTVDGNGKDGLDAIDRFVAKLEEGYDLIQGSRYLPGGAAINTPLDRKLAGRWLHAPLVSWAGGFRYTDTTNGFRGYSARFLEDPRVAPFRAVFSDYSLLFYLSLRAPQLGYRCTEIPVVRSYPASGATPTKIASWRARWSLLRELLDVVRGRFTPEPGAGA